MAGIACRRRDGLDGVEVAAQCGVGFGASVALAQVMDDVRGLRRLLVVVLDELFFGEVVHAFTLSGARPRRSFWTARKTACLAALGAMRSVAAISSVVQASMWRRTNAVRSVAVSSCMARAWSASISRLRRRRSGLAAVSATWTGCWVASA